jgi:hypothetical protein
MTEGLPQACGANCQNCAGNANGSACVAGACGCNVATDCPADHSCDTTTHVCSTFCGQTGYTACNGGCCSPPGLVPSQCTAGTANTSCGTGGAACVNCSNSNKTCVNNACQ